MFTGIIRQLGRVKDFSESSGAAELTVELKDAFKEAAKGESVAINGTCLTIVSHDDDTAVFELGPETLEKTNLSELRPDEIVNMEFPLTMKDTLGGHFVQGHIDGMGKVVSLTEDAETIRLEIELPEKYHKQTILHGSIAIDGVSLTIAERGDKTIKIMLMPYTMQQTNFDQLQVGDTVNIEVDMFAKYIAQQLANMNT